MVKLKADKKEEKKEVKSDKTLEKNSLKNWETKERINDIFDIEKDIIDSNNNELTDIKKNNTRLLFDKGHQTLGSPNKIKTYNDPLETMKKDLISEYQNKESAKIKSNLINIGDFNSNPEIQVNNKDSKDNFVFGK